MNNRQVLLLGVLCVLMTLWLGCGSQSLISPGEQFRNLKQITFHKKSDFDPAISSDSRSLLFVSEREGDCNIYLKRNVNARALIKKTSHKSEDINPCFSPDGKRFVFASNRNGNYDIFIMNTDRGVSKVQLTQSDYDELYPDWCSDGKLIAFSQYSYHDSEWYIWIKNIETGELVQVAVGLSPSHVEVGRYIFYIYPEWKD